MSYIPLDQCKKGYLYRISSRNLSLGVYDGANGFIGIRQKFSDRFLFTEFHWDQGPPFGTVQPQEELGPIPKGIPLRVYLEDYDEVTKRPVAFDTPIANGGRGWFFTDTNEASTKIKPRAQENKELFEYLDFRWVQRIDSDSRVS